MLVSFLCPVVSFFHCDAAPPPLLLTCVPSSQDDLDADFDNFDMDMETTNANLEAHDALWWEELAAEE